MRRRRDINDMRTPTGFGQTRSRLLREDGESNVSRETVERRPPTVECHQRGARISRVRGQESGLEQQRRLRRSRLELPIESREPILRGLPSRDAFVHVQQTHREIARRHQITTTMFEVDGECF